MDQEGGLRVDEDTKPIIDYFEAYKSYIKKLLANNNEIEGVTTGIPKLDTITGGLEEEELTVLAACTSIGKTSIDGSASCKITEKSRICLLYYCTVERIKFLLNE